jgi:hypothetical protein
MNWKCYLGCTFVLALGIFLGVSFPSSGKYQDGRVSACKDMLNVLAQANPLVTLIKIECIPYKGDAALKIGEELFTLDGAKKLN